MLKALEPSVPVVLWSGLSRLTNLRFSLRIATRLNLLQAATFFRFQP